MKLRPLFATRATFAALIDASTRHVDRLVARGLPVIGKGKALRIDVELAVQWLRDREAHEHAHCDATDADEAAGRAAARRARSRLDHA
jgi:phage terminase Nu1 subunit (DNA packaging protein)